MPSPVSCIAPLSARTSLNSVAILSALPPVAFITSDSIPSKPLAFKADAEKFNPIDSAAAAASLDGETNVVITPLTAVMASDVSMPLAVSVDIAPDNSSKLTPKFAAIPTTLPMLVPNSSMVCLPIKVEVKNTSFKWPTSLTSIP